MARTGIAVILAILLNAPSFYLSAQADGHSSSGEIYEAIQRLRVLGSVLYVAAHPDDENTRMISHLANDLKLHTTYLSITRGDGGQNLIGPEISELLGVIRTQELLQARGVDHGFQRFTRANDFGYSKTPEETLEIWNEKEILSDVVWAIRTLQPDVIINRFKAEKTEGNHGHHVASAMLSVKAFDLADDPSVYPEQLAYCTPWQPERILLNTTWWWYGSRENFDKVDKSNMVTIDVGAYNSLNGWSNTEIAAASRSMHKSQGFGATPTRGTEIEYLEFLKGSIPQDKTNLFDGIDITWKRLEGAGHIDGMIQEILQTYDFQRPHLSVEKLLGVRNEIIRLEDSLWRTRKLAEVEDILIDLMGLFMEADAALYHAAPGDSLLLNLEIINRSPVSVSLLESEIAPSGTILRWKGELESNKRLTATRKILIPSDQAYSTPYWLDHVASIGTYTVEDQLLRGLPETPHTLGVRYTLQVLKDTMSFVVPVIYKETDPVRGEVYRPFEVVPPVFVNIQSPAYIFNSSSPKHVSVTVRSVRANQSGVLSLKAPNGWTVSPAQIPIHTGKIGEEIQYAFEVSATSGAVDGMLAAEVQLGSIRCNQMLTEINYDHIPAQTVLRPSVAKIVHVDLKKEGFRIAYIHGAGDDIPQSLEQIGYSVDILMVDAITSHEMLRSYQAVILGIRAYNTLDRIRFVQDHLFKYAEEGGTLITQYNNSGSLNADRLAPYDIKIGRKRVTNENAPVVFLQPEHTALNFPNDLSSADFENWVQERGLYFADSWDQAFEPLLSMSDPGEDALNGSLLVAKHGKGHLVYTSLSFFRQLPDGVPGAYRLFANLIALGQNGKS